MSVAHSSNVILDLESKFNALPWIAVFSGIIFSGAFFHLEVLAVCFALLVCLVFVTCVGSTGQICISTCLWLVLFQNLMIGLGSHLGGNTSSDLRLLTQIPFLLIASVFFGSMLLGVPDVESKGETFKSKWVLLLTVIIALSLPQPSPC